jgi:hypothetical protein
MKMDQFDDLMQELRVISGAVKRSIAGQDAVKV